MFEFFKEDIFLDILKKKVKKLHLINVSAKFSDFLFRALDN